MRNKTKKILKGTLIGALCGATLIGVGATINHLKADDDGLVKVHLNYDIGGLDANGEYEETDASIYTKDAFEAKGLEVTMDFDSNVNYEVFFYDQYGDFISSTGTLDKNYNDEVPLFATHARIEITPESDEDGIKWYEKNGYANQIEIKVDEKQEMAKESGNLFVNYKDGYGFSVDGAGQYNEKEGKSSTDVIDISRFSKVVVSGENMPFAVAVYNQDGSYDMVVFDETSFVNNSWTYVVNENTESMVLSYDTGNVYDIIGII